MEAIREGIIITLFIIYATIKQENLNFILTTNIFFLLKNLYMYLYMSGLEVNKILASIILAVLIVTLIGHFGDLVIDIDHDEKKETD